MKDIFTSLLRETEAGRDCVLAAVAERNGSAPRDAGALMIVGGAGRLAGSVGGGAVEMRAEELAAAALAARQGALRRFSLSALGMLCGGEVALLLVFVPGGAPHWRALASDVLARLARREPGTLLLRPDGEGVLTEERAARPSLRGETLALPLPIAAHAVLFGAGHCGRALAPLLTGVGFAVTVFDDRPAFADSAAFPGAERVICGSYGRISDFLALSPEDYAVIMTESHAGDLEVEAQLLRREMAYIGLIGSKKKIAALNAQLSARGLPPEAAARVHTPIGLAIGAETPEEIAVSIAAELILVRAQRRGKLM